MALNNMALSPALIQELYEHHLVENFDVPLSAIKVEIESIKMLGGNEKNISVLVHCEKSSFLPDAHLSFLVKILEACKIHMSDVGIINTCGVDKDFYDSLIAEMIPVKIILFEVDMPAVGFPLSIPYYQLQKYNNMQIMSFPGLSEIKQDTPIKNKVWTGLKKIFEL